uniref:Ribosomal protein L31 n=1 Tax=Chroomonas placoidea TaxID=173977 RepID=A0A2P1G823_9CRYP|nr:ribosomal protein L31 [Chroomonas placoidea]AVM81107.1 ribosomal protein L31 [Chroomonas placoidea]
MKSKFHFKKNKIWAQLTDGSIVNLNVFSKSTKLKLNVDIKSHCLWKENNTFIVNKDYKEIFLKKFNFFKKVISQ